MRLWSRRPEPESWQDDLPAYHALLLAEASLFDALDLEALGWPLYARSYAERAAMLLARSVGVEVPSNDLAAIERAIARPLGRFRSRTEYQIFEERPATLLVGVPNALAQRLVAVAARLPATQGVALDTMVSLAIFCHAALARHDTARSMAGLRELREVVTEAERQHAAHATLLGAARDLMCGVETRGRLALDRFLAGPLRTTLARELAGLTDLQLGHIDSQRLYDVLSSPLFVNADAEALAAALRCADRRLASQPLAASTRLVAEARSGQHTQRLYLGGYGYEGQPRAAASEREW